jgi:hypothetical protein
MAFTNTIEGNGTLGKWRFKYGTYTSDDGSTGGDIDTGLGNILGVFLQDLGNGAVTDVAAVNETLPDLSGPDVTIVTQANKGGVWIAFEGETTKASYEPTTETTIIDTSQADNACFVLGLCEEGGNGAVPLDLKDTLDRVDGVFLQLLDSAADANTVAVNETLSVDSGQTGGVTLAVTTSKNYLFLAWGRKGGVN